MSNGAAKSNIAKLETNISMETIVIGVIAVLLLVYLFATMIYPENF